MADANTITRIGGILKNTYSGAIVEQQNKAAVTRKRFSKAKGNRLGGDHLEVSVRVLGARGAVGARDSDGALPTATRQTEKKFQIFDRAYFGVIRVFDKDIENTKGNDRAFVNHLDDEITNMVQDVLKVQNIDTFMDGTGILTLVNAGTVGTNAFVGKTSGNGFGAFGTRYLQVGDNIDVYDVTLVTLRGNRNITAINTSTQSVTFDGAVMTLTAGDVVVRGGSVNRTYIGLWSATDNAAVSFQGLSRSTYPVLNGQVLSVASAALSESHLQQILSKIERASGESPDVFLCSQNPWDQYVALGQSLKRYMGNGLDRGFQSLDYTGIPFEKDVDAPPAAIFALSTEYCQNGVLTPLAWMEEDGAVLKWDPGFAAYKAVTREYGNFVYPRPNTCGRIDTLAVGSTYIE